MGTETMSLNLIAPTILLLVSAYEDFKSRKIKNKTLIVLGALSIVFAIFAFDREMLFDGLGGVGLAFLLLMPLYILRAIGAGDVKLSIILGFLVGSFDFLNIFIFALICGCLIGFIKIVIDKKLSLFFKNILHILTNKSKKNLDLQHIPFAVALLAGWVCHLLQQGRIL
jgi:prepilin peptidase CpaA